MPKLNTHFSYSLRSLLVVHLTYLGLLAKMRPGNPSSDTKLTLAFEALWCWSASRS